MFFCFLAVFYSFLRVRIVLPFKRAENQNSDMFYVREQHIITKVINLLLKFNG